MMNHIHSQHKGYILRQIIAVISLVVLAACNVPAEQLVPIDITQTPSKKNGDNAAATVSVDQNWVIVAADHAEEMGIASWLLNSDDFWMPSTDDILKLEGRIAGYLSQNSSAFFSQPPAWERLDEYQRQYIGFEREGRLFIYGNYFCKSDRVNWRQELVFVDDGGDCFFQVEYDTEKGMFIKLLVNGQS